MAADIPVTRECLGLEAEESEIKEMRRKRGVITQAVGVENWRMALRFGALLFTKMLTSSLDWLAENGQTRTRLSFLVVFFAEQGSSSAVYRKTPMKKRPRSFLEAGASLLDINRCQYCLKFRSAVPSISTSSLSFPSILTSDISKRPGHFSVKEVL